MKKQCVYCDKHFETVYPDKLYCRKQCKYRASEGRAAVRGGSRDRQRKRRVTEKQEFVYRDKLLKGCSRCSERRPNCLQYHHLDPSMKIRAVSELVQRGGYSLEVVKNEMEKCILLCANCHAVEETGDGYRDSDRPNIE